MRILYLGDDFPDNTSGHRAAALRRLGHEVTVLNPRATLSNSWIVGGVSTRLGFWPFVPLINTRLRHRIGKAAFDLAWVDCGPELSPGFHRWLKRRGIKIVNYNVDDPFGNRDGRKWDLYRHSVPFHNLTVVVRPENVPEARDAGAQNVVHVYRSYDAVAHAPQELTTADRSHWSSEVVFVGSWMPERGSFMLKLLKAGVPLTIRGDRWHKAPEYEKLKGIIRGPAVYGADYVKAIQCAKVALGLLSKGNRDLHTQRSAEVPFIGGAVFCAERTTEHEAMYQDGEEALFWSSPEECAARCHEILADSPRRGRLAAAARTRVIRLGISNDETLARVLATVRKETVAPSACASVQ